MNEVLGEDYCRIRFGEDAKVPLSGQAWFLIILPKGSSVHFLEFRCTQQGRKDLRRFLAEADEGIRVFGVWHGQYRTDLFVMDKRTLQDRLEKQDVP